MTLKTILSLSAAPLAAMYFLTIQMPAAAQQSEAKTQSEKPLVRSDSFRRSYYFRVPEIPMRDGTKLTANLYLPGNIETVPAPTILIIGVYGRNGGYSAAMKMARAGYATIVVDPRGRGDSEGEFKPFINDVEDNQDVARWITEQDWSNGQIAMRGASYGGFVQWMNAAKQVPGLTTILPSASVWPGYDFPMLGNIGYPYQATWTGFTDGRNANFSLFGDALFWREAFSEVLAKGVAFKGVDKAVGFDSELFDEWTAQPSQGTYWDRINVTAEELAKIDMPILSTTGLFDGAQLAALRYYREHVSNAPPTAAAKHYLIIGPYDHAGVGAPQPRVGGLNVPDAGGVDIGVLHEEWLDWTMRKGERPAFLQDNVMYYVMGDGANEWRSAPTLDAIPVESREFRLSVKAVHQHR